MMEKHLVFYDGTCGLCDGIVRFLHKIDRKKQFLFAPLQGKTAEKKLANLAEEFKNVDSLVLIENYQSGHEHVYVLGKGALKIFWLQGGFWSILGVLSFLPSWPFDQIYRLIARNRHRLWSNDSCKVPEGKERNSGQFLP